jgi:SAM-dependent methyltransferase
MAAIARSSTREGNRAPARIVSVEYDMGLRLFNLSGEVRPRSPMSVLNTLAPRFSKRRLLLSILRDFWYRPSSVIGRLAPLNFYNARICVDLRMHCCICGYEGSMAYDFPDVRLRKAHGIGLLRETMRCKTCGATMRDRQLATALLQIIAERLGQTESDLRAYRQNPLATLRILDTDSFSAISRILRGLAGYVHSQFLPGRPNGEVIADGSVNVNLESIPFPVANFDVILTSDVMEHVANDARAHQEIFRCLAPNGTYLFTVPYDPCIVGHRQLTQRTGQALRYFILEKHIHGDPHSGSGIIAHRIYGRQLLDDLSALGFDVSFESVDRSINGIFGGDIFFARKRG